MNIAARTPATPQIFQKFRIVLPLFLGATGPNPETTA